MRISDWSSDVCSSDLSAPCRRLPRLCDRPRHARRSLLAILAADTGSPLRVRHNRRHRRRHRSEEHTSELQSLMRISYAVFCLKKKIQKTHKYTKQHSMSSNSQQHQKQKDNTST